ncbi:SMI1/KNR4 family protein [Streptomyces sp. H27-D2]|uniref:SMI1/KNR4 family protein n=1 Tax=Streptomyces sp. H27-D2 TaxID=3046304 RepID=UPI002DBF8EAE|nr:SMI1/KNR4 family protein [Streptomyces sp. H27-D2]MEC4016979.1 SMI1/KNR4 family protein [Streptomyces sp. H27-D2]
MTVEQLLKVVTPPSERDAAVDWTAIERELGHGLPRDYKEVVEAYGPGVFDDFIYVYQPAYPALAIDLKTQADRSILALRKLQEEGEPIPYTLQPEPELLSFARTDNGDVCYWRITETNNPDSWTVTVNSARDSDWVEFMGGTASFLRSVLTGEFTVSLFPDDFPSDELEFSPYEID